jgi:hypothetical protein
MAEERHGKNIRILLGLSYKGAASSLPRRWAGTIATSNWKRYSPNILQDSYGMRAQQETRGISPLPAIGVKSDCAYSEPLQRAATNKKLARSGRS